jgi:hypothetical protein
MRSESHYALRLRYVDIGIALYLRLIRYMLRDKLNEQLVNNRGIQFRHGKFNKLVLLGKRRE